MASKKKAAKAKSPSKPAKKPVAKPSAKKAAKTRPIAKSKKSASKASKPTGKKTTPKKVVKPVKSATKKSAKKKPVAKKVIQVKKPVAKKPQAPASKSAGTKSVLSKQTPKKNIPNKNLAKPQQPQVENTPVVVRTKPQIKSPYTGQMPQTRNMNIEKNTDTRSRYSDAELKEFKVLVERKLEDARAELINLNAAVINANENGTDDTGASFKMLEDGSDTLAKEESAQLAIRQKKFIEQLEAALQRIDNKTYGICRVTGKLIAKERLRAVPHTTQSMEAKLKQYRE